MSNKEFLLDNMITKIIKDDEINELLNDQGEFVSLYFLYHIPRFKADSYLLANESIKTNHFNNSYSNKIIKEISDEASFQKQPILTYSEIREITNYALNISEIHDLLNDEKIKESFTNQTKHEILSEILSFFNEWQYSKLEPFITGYDRDLFQLILKIALLSIPQLSSSIPEEEMEVEDFYTGIEKEEQVQGYISKYKQGELTELKDKLFLIITLIEGFLWTLNSQRQLQNFYFNNLFTILASRKGKGSSNQLPIVKSNYFYLNNFKFYFYGDIKSSLKERRKVQSNIANVLRKNLSDILLFSKSIISRLNIDSIQSWYDLSTPIIPHSIAHGITTIWLPEKIGFFEIKDDALESIDDAFKCTQSNPSLSQINEPWSLYITCQDFLPALSDFTKPNSDVSINKEKQQILIKTKNALNQVKYIAIEFSENNKVFKNIESNFDKYKYAFKAFIEKLQYMHRSASLNLNSELWYKKAFCSWYEIFDKIRFKLQYDKIYPNFRSWEKDYFDIFLSTNNNAIIYDMGSCYGRLEENLFIKWNFGNKIQKVYAIDQNQDYLKETKTFSDKIVAVPCDLRNICQIDNQRADMVCFMHTVFGYFKDDNENKSVLVKAYNLLKDGGKLIIDQFHPVNGIKHNGLISWLYPSDENPTHKLIKTSNLQQKSDSQPFGRYYGNYMYFDINDNTEKLIKCDTYDIKLYTEDWFKEKLGLNDNEIFVDTKDDGYTMFIEITKTAKITSENILNRWEDLLNIINKNLPEKNIQELSHPSIPSKTDINPTVEIFEKIEFLISIFEDYLKTNNNYNKFKNEYEKFKF